MNRRTANIIFGVIVLAAGLIMAYYSSLSRGGRGRYELGAAFFPTVASFALAALGLLTVIIEAVKGERDPLSFFNKKFFLGVAAVAAYTVLLALCGYIISGIAMAAAILFLMLTDPVKKAWPYMTLVIVGAPLTIYWIFAKFLLVPLP